ncbi:MAG: DNA-binding protein WhiA [Oscillospiraceae bacterium]|nr:DNA-binding protein WhiA [Oscillospiraceae bacterium]
MSFLSELREEIISLKMWDNNSNLNQDEQLARLYIREAFIKSGFLNDPTKEYHLEVLFKEKEKAEELKNILDSFGVNSKITNKGSDFMVYIKEGEEISNFLALIGANGAVIRFEEIRVEKDMRNNINRIVNCETANLNKTIDASVEQIQDIELLKSKGVFEELKESLKEIAILRVENPDSSYEELGKMLEEPISKSGVSHRLSKISEIAREYK